MEPSCDGPCRATTGACAVIDSCSSGLGTHRKGGLVPRGASTNSMQAGVVLEVMANHRHALCQSRLCVVGIESCAMYEGKNSRVSVCQSNLV